MTPSVSHGAETRSPVYIGKRRIPNLWQRTLANGETVARCTCGRRRQRSPPSALSTSTTCARSSTVPTSVSAAPNGA